MSIFVILFTKSVIYAPNKYLTFGVISM